MEGYSYTEMTLHYPNKLTQTLYYEGKHIVYPIRDILVAPKTVIIFDHVFVDAIPWIKRSSGSTDTC